jgi:hypothetical protein
MRRVVEYVRRVVESDGSSNVRRSSSVKTVITLPYNGSPLSV